MAKAVEYEMSRAGDTDVQWLQIKKGNSSQTLSVAGVVKTWLARLSLAQISRLALDPPILPPLGRMDSTETVTSPHAEAIFSALRGLIAAVPHQPNIILGEIARAAQSITCSSGAAIAMRRDGIVICLSRSGETAPTLGTRLDIDSGISGECLRLGRIVRCDDTSKDGRADLEVCRWLGLRSIAAVPLRERGETVGILEAFSTQPNAFDEEHIDSLRRLAELAESAATEWAAEDADIRGGELPTQPVATAILSIAPSSENSLEGERGRRYRGAGIALVVLFLLSVVGWRAWRNSASGMVGGQQLAPARITQPIANTEAASVVSEPAPVWKPPSPAHLSNPGNKILAFRIAQPVADTEVTHSAPRYRNALAGRDHAFMPAALATADVAAVPKIASSAASNDDLGRLLSASATLPALMPVSRGISGGNLVRKVQPLYPPQALLLRLAGSVVLQATIAENGTVRDLKVMSGRPVLARAAVEAVSHWRYRPFMLNGKPIQKQEEISINFTLPH